VGLLVIITIGIVIVGLGLLILALMRRAQRVVPDVTDRRPAGRKRVVAVDDQGSPIAASPDDEAATPRDAAAFEAVLKEELDDLGR
jgi:hypothetical protein